MLDDFCTVYIDNILIYSNSKKEHQTNVRKILAVLRKAGLQTKIDKCEFHVTEISHLGLIISTENICMDLKKVETIQNWETSTCVKNIQAFIRFANFYRRFIRAYSNILRPMIIAKKKTSFQMDYWLSKNFWII